MLLATVRRFAGMNSLYMLNSFRTACFYSSPIQLNSQNWKKNNRMPNDHQIPLLVAEALRLKRARLVDKSMLQRMDNFLSQPENLAKLNPKQFCN
jgi:ribosome assembly protein YihI (activator of Der GTPase)